MSVAVEKTKTRRVSESGSDVDQENDPHFEPVIQLPEIEISTNEENEEELVKLRAKLFRFDTSEPQKSEWKERGTGEVKLLRHKENNSVRVVMRRDKTLKICANHFVTPWMELKPSCGSNRAWVWTVLADFADETAKSECLAIRFANAEIATQWKNKFEEAKQILIEKCELYKNNTSSNTLNSSSDNESDTEKPNGDDKKEEIEDKKESKEDEKVIKKMADLNVSK